MKASSLIKKYKEIILLLSLYIGTRLSTLIFRIIPFSFDHGKDSLAVMHMLLLKSPKLIGPWTSIPGLYFGPGWYYLLAPGFLLSNFHPTSGTITIILLGLIQLWLVWKYFNFLTALILISTPMWLMVTTSAWNPFPLTLVSWLILIILEKLSLKKTKDKKKHSPQLALWGFLGILMASGFHFSTAFAVLYPILILISIRIREIKISWKKIFSSLIGFSIPFIPQLLFELRHSFVQTKGIFSYIKGDVNIETGAKPSIFKVLFETLHEVRKATLPNITHNSWENLLGLLIIITVIFLSWKWRNKAGKQILKKRLIEFSCWLMVTVLWLSLTHFNFWYLYGLMPFAVVLFREFLKHINHKYSMLFAGLLIFASFLHIFESANLSVGFSKSRQFLPIKQQAINLIYEKSNGEPFSSYHYVPDIYDFSYQYIYFWNAEHGKKLPVEFSYEPNITQYITQKLELLNYFEKSITKGPATKVFFIVEKPQIDFLLEDWWNRQKYGEIINEFKLSDEVTVFEATP